MKAWRGEVSAPRRARLRSRVVAVVLVVFEQRVEVVRRFVLPRKAQPPPPSSSERRTLRSTAAAARSSGQSDSTPTRDETERPSLHSRPATRLISSASASGRAVGVDVPRGAGLDAHDDKPSRLGQPGDSTTNESRAGTGALTLAARDASDGQREPARAVELRPWAAWWLLATRKRGTERKHRRRQVGAPLAEEQNQPFAFSNLRCARRSGAGAH